MQLVWGMGHFINELLRQLIHLPTYREVRGRGKPSRKGGGCNLPSVMQLVWGMGHFVNEVLRQLFLFGVAVITSQSVISYRR